MSGMLRIHGSFDRSSQAVRVQRVGVGRRDRMVVNGRVVAQARELAHRRLRALRLVDVGHHAARDLHRHQRIGVDVGIDGDLARLQLLGCVLGRGLGLDGHLVHGLLDLRFFLLAARCEGGDCRDREHRYEPFDYSHASPPGIGLSRRLGAWRPEILLKSRRQCFAFAFRNLHFVPNYRPHDAVLSWRANVTCPDRLPPCRTRPRHPRGRRHRPVPAPSRTRHRSGGAGCRGRPVGRSLRQSRQRRAVVALCRLAHLARERTGLCDLGLRACTNTGLAALGLLGYLVANSASVGRGLAALQEFLQVHDEGATAYFAGEGDSAVLGYEVLTPGVPGADQLTFGALAIAANVLRSLCGAGFRFRKSTSRTAPRRTFRCSGASSARLSVSMRSAVRWLSKRVGSPLPWPGRTRSSATSWPKRSGSNWRTPPMRQVDRLRRVVRSLVAGGRFTVDDLAAAFALSRRTLARRLNEHGTSFNELLDEARFLAAGTCCRAPGRPSRKSPRDSAMRILPASRERSADGQGPHQPGGVVVMMAI